jgi:hypothetical protein
MQNEIQSKSTKDTVGITSKQFILPNGVQLLLYLLIGVLLLMLLNIGKIWTYLNTVILSPEGGLDSILANQVPWLHNLLNRLSQSVALQFLFWLCVGCIIYIFLWFVKNIFINLRNDMVADKFVHPSAYNRKHYWESVIARKAFLWVSVVMLLVFAVTSGRLLFSLATHCYNQVVTFQMPSSLINLSISVAAVTGLIYIFVLLIHIAINSWQLTYKDL